MEFSPLNKLYGQGELLRRHAGLPSWLPLPFVVQHGWFGGVPQPDSAAELVSGLSGIWAWNDESARGFQRVGRDVFIGGAPFLYALAQRPLDASRQRSGTIIFPSHGTRDIVMEGDYEHYVDALVALPLEFQPLLFCLHPSSFGSALERVLRARGCDVTSNGAPQSPDYLFRFIENAGRCRYATANELTTALIYCAYMGLTGFLLGPAFRYLNIGSPHLPLGVLEPRDTPTLRRLTRQFEFEAMNAAAQRESAATELGPVVTPDVIRQHVRREYLRLRPHRIVRSTASRLALRIKHRYEQ